MTDHSEFTVGGFSVKHLSTWHDALLIRLSTMTQTLVSWYACWYETGLACENIRLSSLFVAVCAG